MFPDFSTFGAPPTPSAPPPQNLPPTETKTAVSKPSDELLKLRNISARLFQGLCGFTANGIASLVRFPGASGYFILVLILAFAAIAFLVLYSPPNKQFISLYRSGAVAVIFGTTLAFWDLLYLVPIWVWIGFVAFTAWVLAILGRD